MREGAPANAMSCRSIERRRPGVGYALVVLGLVMMVIALPVLGFLMGWAGAFATLLSAIFTWAQAARAFRTTQRGGTLTLEPGALRVMDDSGELQRVRFEDIVSGYEVPSEQLVVLQLARGAQISIRLEDGSPAQVLAHAGVGPAQRALVFPLRRMVGAFTIGAIVFWPLLMASMATVRALLDGSGVPAYPLGTLMAALATVLVVARYGFPHVVVGTDGIRLLGVLHPRFLPYEAISGVEIVRPPYAGTSRFIEVLLHDGSALALPTFAAPTELVEGLAWRIEDAARAHAAGDAGRLDALARGGRSLGDWKKNVARLALAPPGFRDYALGRDEFERVLVDAAAPPDQRIGAALALRLVEPATARGRIRVAADASADDALREALALAAEGEVDDETLERAGARKIAR